MNTMVLRLLFVGALWLVVIGQISCDKLKGEDQKSSLTPPVSSEIIVKAVPVTHQEWIETASISGNLRTLSTVDVKPEVGGRLIAASFKEGDFVRKDQLLAEIDPINYKLAYDQALAVLAVAKASLERVNVSAKYARTEKKRADNLRSSGGITEKDHQAAVTGVEEAEAQIRLAEAQCEQAQAAVAIAEKALKDCKIYAPAQGHVLKRYFDKGSLLAPGVSLYTLVDNSQLELECVVPSYQLASIHLKQRVVFTTPTWGDRTYEGTVAAINPTVESDNRSVKLFITIDNPKGELRSGMYARGEIITRRVEGAFVVSRDSLIPEREESDEAGVYIVKEGKAHRVQVQIGGSQKDQVWIRRGLDEGEFVITEIGPSMKEGTPVRIVE